MARQRKYTPESIARALTHHETTGAVRTVSPPEPGGRATWRIDVPGFETVEFTTAQAYAFVVGLAAAERAYQPLTLGGS